MLTKGLDTYRAEQEGMGVAARFKNLLLCEEDELFPKGQECQDYPDPHFG